MNRKGLRAVIGSFQLLCLIISLAFLDPPGLPDRFLFFGMLGALITSFGWVLLSNRWPIGWIGVLVGSLVGNGDHWSELTSSKTLPLTYIPLVPPVIAAAVGFALWTNGRARKLRLAPLRFSFAVAAVGACVALTSAMVLSSPFLLLEFMAKGPMRSSLMAFHLEKGVLLVGSGLIAFYRLEGWIFLALAPLITAVALSISFPMNPLGYLFALALPLLNIAQWVAGSDR